MARRPRAGRRAGLRLLPERPGSGQGRLAQRLNLGIARANDLAIAAVVEAERERRGSEGALVYRERTAKKGEVFGEPVGLTFESNVARVIYSLWIRIGCHT